MNRAQNAGFGPVVSAIVSVALAGLSFASPLGNPGDAGDIYVIASADIGFGPDSPAVLQYDGATGSFVGKFAAKNAGQFNGMTWGPNGNLYTTHMLSTNRWRVAEFDGTTGTFIQNVIDFTATGGNLSIAKGLVFGPDGDLYVGNFWDHSVTRYDGVTFAIKATTSITIGTPSGMHFAPNGELWVLSGGFNSIRRYDVSGNGITDLGDFATVPGTVQPQDFTWGPNGNVFVGRGSAGGVAELDGATGTYLQDFVPANSSLPANGLAFDTYGRLMLAVVFPISRIDEYDAVTGAYNGIFINDQLGSSAIPTIITIKQADENTGSALCFGDGTGANCPCGASGNPGEGCANTGGMGGATLAASGDGNFTADTFGLQVSGIPGSRPGLCMKGTNQLGGGNGVLSGDGLLCIGSQIRSQVILSDASGTLDMTNWKGQAFGTYPGAANVGTPTYYQWWYRDPGNTCSGQGFNFTNAWGLTWTP